MATEKSAATAIRARYHHGHLRETLIEAAHRLIQERGPNGFSMADACRMAGVSTAAPYRHFADRTALVAAVIGRGFEDLTVRIRAGRDSHPAGTMDSIIAMGQAYVAFAADDGSLFQLMWGKRFYGIERKHMAPAGDACFNVLLEAVDAFRRARDLTGVDTLTVALPLWTLVHGTASLVLGDCYEAVAPGTDPGALVATATRAYLTGLLVEVGDQRP